MNENIGEQVLAYFASEPEGLAFNTDVYQHFADQDPIEMRDYLRALKQLGHIKQVRGTRNQVLFQITEKGRQYLSTMKIPA